MKLDVNVLRYLSKDDFRVLTSIEMGQKNHELVPVPLIDSISGLKHGGAFKCIQTLLRHKLVHHESQKYEGYRLTNMGYDFLAIRALLARGHISGIGRQIGIGKESDIFEVTNEDGEVFALKLHRLGRNSFRAVKSKRDYLGKRSSYSWLYLSRLAALKEFAFMRALGDNGFPVPQAIDCNRHAVLMTLLDASPLVQIKKLTHPGQVYLTCMELLSRLASKGLVHCDFNEFNLLIADDEELTIIDFPQMVSVSHANAKELFERDVECIHRFFSKKVGYIPENDPALPYIRPSFEEAVAAGGEKLDVDLGASGFKKHQVAALEDALVAARQAREEEGEDGEGASGSGEGDEEDGEEEEEEGGRLGSGSEDGEGEEAEGTGRVGDPGVGAEGEEGEGSEPGGSGSEEEESESEEGEEGEEEGAARQRRRERRQADKLLPKVARVVAPSVITLGERDVQQLVFAQRRRDAKREAAGRISRNATKAAKGKGTKKGKGGGGTGAEFGGW